MNLDKALVLAREVKTYIKNELMESHDYKENNLDVSNDYKNIVLLENMIEEEIKLKGFAETGQKAQYKRALTVLARCKKLQRKVLEYAFTNNEGVQYFTDSYIAFALKNIVVGLPEMPKEMTYPNLENIFQLSERANGSNASFNCQELKEKVKLASDEFVDIVLSCEKGQETIAKVDKKLLLDVLITLGYKNNDEVLVWFNPYRLGSVNVLPPYTHQALVFKRESNGLEDRAILLPMRVPPKEQDEGE